MAEQPGAAGESGARVPPTPAVSIIIPAYNATRTLAATLDSVVRQTFQDFEVLVVDDGSTDGTADLARSYAGRLCGLTVTSRPNGGVSVARNYALRHARGDYVASLDADDLWHPTYLEKLVGALRAAGPGTLLAYAVKRLIDLEGNVLNTPPILHFEGYVFHRMLHWNPVSNGSGIVMTRQAVIEVGGWEETYQRVSDGYIQAQLAAIGKVVCVPEYLVGYRQVPGSVSSNKTTMGFEGLGVLKIARRSYPNMDRQLLRAATARRAARSLQLAYLRGEILAALRFAAIGLVHESDQIIKAIRKVRRGGTPHTDNKPDATTGRAFYDLDPLVPDFRQNVKVLKEDVFSLAERADAVEAQRRGIAV